MDAVTDKDRFIALLQDFGVVHEERDADHDVDGSPHAKVLCVDLNTPVHRAEVTSSQAPVMDATTEFIFDADGKFLRFGVWED